jgi:hypothetical protein
VKKKKKKEEEEKKKKKKKKKRKKKKPFPSLLKLVLVIKNDGHGSRTITYPVDKMPQHGLRRTLWSL